jgi:phosphatidyl-myo-inositol dimannoside synthase
MLSPCCSRHPNGTVTRPERVLFVTRRYPPSVGGMEQLSYKITTLVGVRRRVMVMPGSQRNLVWWLPVTALRAAVAARRGDVVHLGDAALSLVGVLVKAVSHTPVVMTVHGLDLTFPNVVYQWYLRWLCRPDLIIANSGTTAEQARAHGLGPVVVVPLGVDDREPASPEEPAPEVARLRAAGKRIVLTTGRLVARKGVAWFVAEVLPRLPEDVVYVVVGEGNARRAIEAAIATSGTQDRVILLGQVSDAQRDTLYATADCFVMPNVVIPGDMEGFGLVALEASVTGLPVVAARLDGIVDAVHDRRNGVLVEASDAAAFTKAVLEVLEYTPQQRAAVREYTLSHFSWQAMAEAYDRAIAEHLARSSSRT